LIPHADRRISPTFFCLSPRRPTNLTLPAHSRNNGRFPSLQGFLLDLFIFF
jgi:hypothetical protein